MSGPPGGSLKLLTLVLGCVFDAAVPALLGEAPPVSVPKGIGSSPSSHMSRYFLAT